RPLTEVRDAKIFIETVDALVEHFQEHLAGRAFSDIHKMSQANLRGVRKRVLNEQNALTVAATRRRGGPRRNTSASRIRGTASCPRCGTPRGHGFASFPAAERAPPSYTRPYPAYLSAWSQVP